MARDHASRKNHHRRNSSLEFVEFLGQFFDDNGEVLQPAQAQPSRSSVEQPLSSSSQAAPPIFVRNPDKPQRRWTEPAGPPSASAAPPPTPSTSTPSQSPSLRHSPASTSSAPSSGVHLGPAILTSRVVSSTRTATPPPFPAASQGLQPDETPPVWGGFAPPPSTLSGGHSLTLMHGSASEPLPSNDAHHALSDDGGSGGRDHVEASATLPSGAEITITPTLWRDAEERLMVTVGVRTVPQASATDATFYTAMNPRIITTGVPPKKTSLNRFETHSAPLATSSFGRVLRNQTVPSVSVASSSQDMDTDEKETYIIQELWLVKKDPHTREQRDVWRHEGEVEGTTVPGAPAWPGDWLIDVMVRVSDGGASYWLGAWDRRVEDPALMAGEGGEVVGAELAAGGSAPTPIAGHKGRRMGGSGGGVAKRSRSS